MEIKTDFNFETKYNQLEYEAEVYLDNGSSNPNIRYYGINPNSIVNLTIEETLANWQTVGHMTFFYNPEASVGVYNSKTGQYETADTGITTPKQKSFFHFRNDGYDQLRIRFFPKKRKTSNLERVNAIPDYDINDPKHWTLSYLFSIYDMEDIDQPPGAQNAASATTKALKIYFWDSWYQKMITNTLQYSTALSQQANIESDKQQGIYYNPGVISTGQAMKEIIDLSLSDNASQANYTGNIIPDTRLQFNYSPTLNGDDWDNGAAKIFYTAPAQATALDSLMYIHDKHVSSYAYNSVNDYALFYKERGPQATDTGQLALKPISKFFQKAGKTPDSPGEYQIEHYFVQSYTSTDRPSKTFRSPTSNSNNPNVDFKSLKYNQITNYRFVDIAALTNTTQFCTTPVYSFDFNKREFNVEFKDNSVQTARDFISKNYIDNVYKKGNNEKLFLLSLEKDKIDKNIKPTFSLYGDNKQIRQADGLQKLLYVGLFQNACINFRTLGLTNREPGRFIAIDKTDGVESGLFEDKFYGQWFVINIKHIFESEIYYNDITAIKIHRFEPLPINFPDTI